MFKFVQCSIKWCLTHSDWYYLWKFMESNVTSVLCCEFLFMSDSHFQQFHVKSSSFSLKITINWENVNSWISCFTQMVGSEITFMFDSWKFYSRLITKLPYFAILGKIIWLDAFIMKTPRCHHYESVFIMMTLRCLHYEGV